MKAPTGFGSNSKWIAAGNFYAQLPFGPSIFGVFADLGMFPHALNDKPQMAYDAGLAVRLGKVFGLYFPLVMSDDMEKSFGTMNYTARIRMTFRMSITNRGLDLKSLMN